MMSLGPKSREWNWAVISILLFDKFSYTALGELDKWLLVEIFYNASEVGDWVKEDIINLAFYKLNLTSKIFFFLYLSTFHIISKKYICIAFLFYFLIDSRERGRGEKERERNISASCTGLESTTQAHAMTRIDPSTCWFVRWHASHWATLARVLSLCFLKCVIVSFFSWFYS